MARAPNSSAALFLSPFSRFTFPLNHSLKYVPFAILAMATPVFPWHSKN